MIGLADLLLLLPTGGDPPISGKAVTIKGWAAGGAGGVTLGGNGGAFTWSGAIPSGTVLTAKVGQGGISEANGHQGGGRTQISWTGNVLIAGAGGAGGTGGTAGGPGGGGAGGDAVAGGTGGTQSAGGSVNGGYLQGGAAPAGSGNPTGASAWPNGGPGAILFGGAQGGGGGDGYYGGGGGQAGGGGSGYNGTASGTATLYTATGDPGNAADPDRAGAGQQGNINGGSGANGRVVIYVDGVLVATLTFTGADQTYTIV